MPAAAMAARNSTPRRAPRAPRGPAAGRGTRTDRDGDLNMGLSVKSGAGISKSSSPARVGRDRDPTSRLPKGGILSEAAQRHILRQAASGTSDVKMAEARSRNTRSGGLAELRITNWSKSKASHNTDGGVSALERWLERRASTRLGSRVRSVQIKKSRVEGQSLIISVAEEDVSSLLRLSGYQWAGVNVTIERVGSNGDTPSAPAPETERIRTKLRGVLERRYNFDTKLLDLSALGTDEDLRNEKMFDKKSTTSKFFPAMMKVLELSFDKPEEKDASILSVSLANNDLADLEFVTDLSRVLPKLQNLDLSGNQLPNLNSLARWRKRFYHLQHLILSGNPLEKAEPNYTTEIVKWYPNLRQLNGIQVRTEEEVAQRVKVNVLPFPVKSALFQDEGSICETFIRNFFPGFDKDRAALATHYYDDRSDFSVALNTAAPRDPSGAHQTVKQEWDDYIKYSRNLKRIAHLPTRQQRRYVGPKAIADAWASLPGTQHPDLTSEAQKWMIEAHLQPGVPDPTGQAPSGVDGFMISIHGEFAEVASGQAKKTRSFDRLFILGPGGPSGVRVVNDMLHVRAYGGAQAFEPDLLEGWNLDAPAQHPTTIDQPQQPPAGITVEVAEQMVAELVKQTGMTLPYAKDCLDQTGWNFDEALAAFTRVRTTLPPEAFMAQST